MTEQFLYHYTIIDELALILKNKSICFNDLLLVDDLEEAESDDIENVIIAMERREGNESNY